MDTYRKWPFQDKPSIVWKLNSKFCLSSVALLSRLWLNFNRITVYNIEGFIQHVDNRKPGRGLITVSNHYSCLDEPLMWGLLKFRHMTYQTHVMRWALAAEDICFTRASHAWFFSHGRTIPVVRGGGVYQKGMDYALKKIEDGSWVHTFPEGKVNMKKEYLRLKWGVGRLIGECDHTPLVVPFYHVGMNDVLHNEPPYIPHVGEKVTVLFGEAIDFDEQLVEMRRENKTNVEIRKVLTDRIQAELKVLRLRVEKLHDANQNPRLGITHHSIDFNR